MGELDAELAQAIARVVEERRGESVLLLQELVRIPSVTGDEGAVQEVVERAFRERGLAIDVWEASPEEISPYKEHVGEQGGLVADRTDRFHDLEAFAQLLLRGLEVAGEQLERAGDLCQAGYREPEPELAVGLTG